MGALARARNLAPRMAAGAYILNSGLSKRGADPETAKGLHHFASGAYPALEAVEPERFVRTLSATEIAIGGALLTPFVPVGVAGLALTGLGAGLVGLYLRTPELRQDDSLRPSEDGMSIAKDVWLLGMGLGLLVESLRGRRSRKRREADA